MIVRCTNCRTAFSVNDAKIKNKKFSFNCPKCSEENIFDNRTERDEPVMETLPTAATTDFSNSTFAEERAIERPAPDRAVGRSESMDDFSGEVAGGTAEFDAEAFDEKSILDDISEVEPPESPAGEKRPDLTIDDIDTNINLDDIDIDIGSEEKNGKAAGTSFDESDLILDEMEPETRGKKEDSIFDELSEDIHEKQSAETSLEDVNIDDILLPDDEPAEKKSAKGEDRGDILDLEEDLVTLEDVEFDSSEGTQRENDIAADSILSDTGDQPDDREPEFREVGEDEDIKLDLDSLDIDLDGDEELLREVKMAKQHQAPEVAPKAATDENLTLDLDSLDIELAEDEMIMEGEQPDDLDLLPPLDDVKKENKAKDKDEDLTLDLDSLDITLEETEEFMEGEVLDEDEKLTLQDAGLTIEELTTDESTLALEDHDSEEDIKLTLDEIDPSLSGDLNELTTDEITATVEAEEEEDIKLSIDEIDPNLKVDDIGDDIFADEVPSEKRSRASARDEDLLIDEIDELPEIDLEDELVIDEGQTAATPVVRGETRRRPQRVYDEEMIDIDLHDDEDYSIKKKKNLSDITLKGSVSLSIDYSIKNSRLGALARLFGLFGMAIIPHFIVLLLYTVLSVILGFLNHLIVLIRRDAMEDFTQFIENTVRYFISIHSSLVGVVEEFPIFTGKESVDHPLQMKVTYPLHNSRFMALLRLSIAGIVLVLFPHLLIAGILSLVIPIMYVVGIVAVIVTGRWPSILFDFLMRYYRYCARILCYGTGIVDEYPSFKFD